MFGKKFFSTVALGGAAVSSVGNVGSFAEEQLPSDGGVLFKCKNPEVPSEDYDFDLYGVDLQLLVNHFRLDRQETEKLLKCIKLFLEKYEKLDEFSVNLNLEDSFSEVGQIGFGAVKHEMGGFYFYISKKHNSGSSSGYYQPYMMINKSAIDKMLSCNLDNIKFCSTLDAHTVEACIAVELILTGIIGSVLVKKRNKDANIIPSLFFVSDVDGIIS